MTSTMDYGAVVDRGPWPEAIAREFERARDNGCVGTRLISETERVRVWEIRLKPGERISFHRLVLRLAGETQHESYGPGESKIHDLKNTGDAELVFITVEFLDSANAALPVPGEVRAKAA